MKGSKDIVFIRADLWNTTKALPKAIEAAGPLFDNISILEWSKHSSVDENRFKSTPHLLLSFRGSVGSSGIGRVLSVIHFLVWVLAHLKRIKPNYIHFIGIYNIPAVLLFKIFNPRTVLVYEIRDPYAFLFRRKALSFLLHHLDRLLMRFTNFIILPNEYLLDYVSTAISRDRIFISPNYGRIKEGDTDSSFNGDKMNFGYFGYLSGERGLKMMENLVRNYQNEIILHLAGNFNESIIKVFRKYENVIYHGHVNRMEALNLMKSVDANLMLYDPDIKLHSYMLPIKFYDSCMQGTPVIVSKGMAALESEVTSHGLGYSLEYMKDSDLGKLIQEMRRSPVEAKLLQDYFFKKCNYEEFMLGYHKFYKNITNE
jgi:hypothetical protein